MQLKIKYTYVLQLYYIILSDTFEYLIIKILFFLSYYNSEDKA